MTQHANAASRRHFIKLTVSGLAAAPMGVLFSNAAAAAEEGAAAAQEHVGA